MFWSRSEIREKDIPLATALVESTYSAYKAGKLGFAELVLSRKTLSDLRLQDIQLRSAIVQNHLKCLNQCE
jgi:ribosomal protein L20